MFVCRDAPLYSPADPGDFEWDLVPVVNHRLPVGPRSVRRRARRLEVRVTLADLRDRLLARVADRVRRSEMVKVRLRLLYLRTNQLRDADHRSGLDPVLLKRCVRDRSVVARDLLL